MRRGCSLPRATTLRLPSISSRHADRGDVVPPSDVISMPYRSQKGPFRPRRSRRRERRSPTEARPSEFGENVAGLLQVLFEMMRWAVRRAFGRPGSTATTVRAPSAPPKVSPRRSSPPPAPLPPRGRRPTLADGRPLPYLRQPHLLTKGERAAWYPLYRAVQGRYRLFCKVRLADIVRAPETLGWNDHWFRKIRGYHVDFVVCDPESTEPLLVVELDDRSHETDRQRERDDFKGCSPPRRGRAGPSRPGGRGVRRARPDRNGQDNDGGIRCAYARGRLGERAASLNT